MAYTVERSGYVRPDEYPQTAPPPWYAKATDGNYYLNQGYIHAPYGDGDDTAEEVD